MAVKTLAPATVSYLSDGLDMPAAFAFSPVVSITYPASDAADGLIAQSGGGSSPSRAGPARGANTQEPSGAMTESAGGHGTQRAGDGMQPAGGHGTQRARRDAKDRHEPGLEVLGDASAMDLGSVPLQRFARPLILHMPHCFDPDDAADSIVMLVRVTRHTIQGARQNTRPEHIIMHGIYMATTRHLYHASTSPCTASAWHQPTGNSSVSVECQARALCQARTHSLSPRTDHALTLSLHARILCAMECQARALCQARTHSLSPRTHTLSLHARITHSLSLSTHGYCALRGHHTALPNGRGLT